MRIFGDGVDVTSKIVSVLYNPVGLTPPKEGSLSGNRYGFTAAPQSFSETGAFLLPTNVGCQIRLEGFYSRLEAYYSMEVEDNISITALGSQNMTCHSYVAQGWAGEIASLPDQMQAKFGYRHDTIQINPPAGTDYVLVKFVAKPFNESWPTEGIPTGGTYRFWGLQDDNVHLNLSADHTSSHALPLFAHWADADFIPNEPFHPAFKNVQVFSCPEYFAPPGIGYHPCMTSGGCPNTLLDQIFNATAQETIYFYKVERKKPGLMRIPLRAAGPKWSASTNKPTFTSQPVPQTLEADNKQGCPCGWFDKTGRMLDYVPAP